MSRVRLIAFLAWRQLMDRKGLNAVGVGAVALGVVAFVAISALFEGALRNFQDEMLRNSPHVMLYGRRLDLAHGLLADRYPPDSLIAVAHDQPGDRSMRIVEPSRQQRILESIEGVLGACPMLTGGASASIGARDQSVEIRGISPREYLQCKDMRRFVIAGAWSDLAIDPDAVAIGSGLAEFLGASVGDRIAFAAPGGPRLSYRVATIFETTLVAVDRTRVFLNVSAAQSLLQMPTVLNTIELRIAEPFRSVQMAARVEALTGYDAESWQEVNDNMIKLFGTQVGIARIVSTTILVIGGFGILAIQIMLVLEKTRQISILRSIGLTRTDILLLFVAQGVIIALVGSMLGCIGGWRAVETLAQIEVPSNAFFKSNRMPLYRGSEFYFIGSAFAITIGLLASLLPAWRGARVEPVDVLRGQIT